MKKKIIKISESQLYAIRRYIAENKPFSYTGNETTDNNTNSSISVNVPFDSPDVDPINTTGDEVAQELSNTSWWNRRC